MDVLESLNKFANLFLAVLTLLLLGATTFYAWVTYHLLQEAAESRKASVRPLLLIHFLTSRLIEDKDRAADLLPAVKTHGLDKHFKKGSSGAFMSCEGKSCFSAPFLVDFEIANQGRGAAIAPRARFVYFSENEEECGLVLLKVPEDRIESGSRCTVKDAFFWSDQFIDENAKIRVTLEVSFQDVEGNMYLLSREYSAEPHWEDKSKRPLNVHLHWYCKWEALRMWTYKDRPAAWTPEVVLPFPVEPDQIWRRPQVVYERRRGI